MNQTMYRTKPIRSPIQPDPVHPVQRMQEKAMNTSGNADHPVRKALRKLCANQLRLCVSFSEDSGALSTLKIPGLVALRCVISDEKGKPLGIGYSSSYLTRINRSQERTIFSCLNGSLLSGINAVCKSLDAIRLEEADKDRDEQKRALGEAYQARDGEENALASLRQVEYLKHLLVANASDEERDALEPNLDTLSRADASELISRYATR